MKRETHTPKVRDTHTKCVYNVHRTSHSAAAAASSSSLSQWISFDLLVVDSSTHFIRFQLNCILMELKHGSLRTNEKIQCIRFIRKKKKWRASVWMHRSPFWLQFPLHDNFSFNIYPCFWTPSLSFFCGLLWPLFQSCDWLSHALKLDKNDSDSPGWVSNFL